MVAVRGEDEGAGDDVVREHLPVVFAALFNVDYDDLLQVECEFYEIVPFSETIHFAGGPFTP